MFKILSLIILILLQQGNIWGTTQEWFSDRLNLDQPVMAESESINVSDPSVYSPPKKTNQKSIKPFVKAKSAIAVDQKSGQILYQKDENTKLPIASITKLMTALVVIDENSLTEKVIVSKKDTQTEGVKMWLYPGEKIRIRDLLKGLLVHSAADAAQTLARHTSGNEKKFVETMNTKAKLLGLENTQFVSPTGLNGNGGDNYSTAKEISDLARVALENNFIQKTVNIENTTVHSTDGNIPHELENTNKLLNSYLDIRGIKTGYTKEAGECLVTLAQGSNRKEKVITVVLDSPDRFQESKVIVDWVFRNFRW
ncbi:D-alanyl-D-alanine carboxypeptidase family protein [Patescibacteria group bacterium]